LKVIIIPELVISAIIIILLSTPYVPEFTPLLPGGSKVAIDGKQSILYIGSLVQ